MVELFRRAPQLVDPRFGELRWSRDLWPHIKLVGVWVGAHGKSDDVELAPTGWDREHTIGVTVSGGQITDFCASI